MVTRSKHSSDKCMQNIKKDLETVFEIYLLHDNDCYYKQIDKLRNLIVWVQSYKWEKNPSNFTQLTKWLTIIQRVTTHESIELIMNRLEHCEYQGQFIKPLF